MLATTLEIPHAPNGHALRTPTKDPNGEHSRGSHLLNVYKRLPFKITRGLGSYVQTQEGKKFLDFYSAHAVASLGHGHPKLNEALHKQIDRLLFYSNLAEIEHQEEAATLLASQLPPQLSKVFLINSGAEAMENALKVARMVTGKPGVISFSGGFHGRTLGALSATALGKYRQTVGIELKDHYYAPLGQVDHLEDLLRRHPIAAVVVEPIQSLAGVVEVPLAFLRTLREMCTHFGAALVFDELQTGGGRVGKAYCFSTKMGLNPDMITLGKGIGAGIPVAALALRDSWAQAIAQGDLGTTFGGGPLACVALKKTLEIVLEEGLYEHVEDQSRLLREQLEPWFLRRGLQVRGQGFLLGLKTPYPASLLHRELLNRGIITGTCDDPSVLRLMPPLNVRQEEISFFMEELTFVLESLS